MINFLSVLFLFISTSQAQEFKSSLAQSNDSSQAVTELETVVVGDKLRLRMIKANEINRVESVDGQVIDEKKATTFAQAIAQEKGVSSQTSCAFCGAKRVTINGLKGEHTTILIDGIPLHSTISSFYGVEAIPLEGIDTIDIYRGSGSSLAAPESIGGALNIVTVDPFIPQKKLNISSAHDKTYSVRLGLSHAFNDKWAVFLGGQKADNPSNDVDDNRVAEVAHQKIDTYLVKTVFRPNSDHEISLRLSWADLGVFGGSLNDYQLDSSVPFTVTSDDFQDADVRKKYLSTDDKMTDNIFLKRNESALIYKYFYDSDWIFNLKIGRAEQKQQAIYSHGYDYNNWDLLYFSGLEFQKNLDDHFVSLGLDFKSQTMRSESEVLYNQTGLLKDNLDHQVTGFYVQDNWILNEQHEISWAIRFDQLQVQWKELQHKLSQDVIAPRLYYKWVHNDQLTSRWGLGLGYRAPLTLFESQHGTYHDGFLIDIDKIEQAQSFLYSLAAHEDRYFYEFSVHLTNIKHMAYGLDRADQDLPTVFMNSSEDYLISVFDLNWGWQINPQYQIETLFEMFNYPRDYKSKLPVAAQEKRFSIKSSYEFNQWTFQQKINIVLAQDLSAYGYDKHYNIAFTGTDPFDPDTFGQTVYRDQKRQMAPTFATFDFSMKKKSFKEWNYEFEIKNVFDYTQTSAGDSPLAWAQHGDHFHLDNLHIWGPLIGRQFYLSLSKEF